MKLLLSIILLLSASNIFAQSMPTYLNYLKKVKLEDYYIFGYDPSNTKYLNDNCSNPNSHWGCKDINENEHLIATVNDNIAIVAGTSPGGHFYFTLKNKNNQTINTFMAREFYITSAGVIYTVGEGSVYNRRKKYQLKSNMVKEEKQSYYYVGLKTHTSKAITLYKNKTGNEVIANLPAEYEVEVLLEDGGEGNQYFLIRTDFGLVGWLRITPSQENPIYELISTAG